MTAMGDRLQYTNDIHLKGRVCCILECPGDFAKLIVGVIPIPSEFLDAVEDVNNFVLLLLGSNEAWTI